MLKLITIIIIIIINIIIIIVIIIISKRRGTKFNSCHPYKADKSFFHYLGKLDVEWLPIQLYSTTVTTCHQPFIQCLWPLSALFSIWVVNNWRQNIIIIIKTDE